MFIQPSLATNTTSTTSYPSDQKTLNINADSKKTKRLADIATDALNQAPLKKKPAPSISYEESNVSGPKLSVIELPKEIMLHIFSYLNPDQDLAISKEYLNYKTEASFSATWVLKALKERKMNKVLTLIQNEHLEFNSKNLDGLWYFLDIEHFEFSLRSENTGINKIKNFVKKAILKHPDLLPNDRLLRAASYFGLINFIPNILKEHSSKQPLHLPEGSIASALKLACDKNHPEIVKLLLIDKHGSAGYAYRNASYFGHLEVVRLLLADNRVNPADKYNDAIRSASENGRFETVRLLLTDIRVNPADNHNDAILLASGNGHFETVRLLLTDNRVDPAVPDNEAIRWASTSGYLELVRLLLADIRVDPAARNNEAIRIASQKGRFETVRLLLNDIRVDPAALNNEAIRCASEKGHVETVRLLLDDIRVDPADKDNEAIRLASQNGHVETVRLLLDDIRVDPAALGNHAISCASQNGHVEIVRLLLDDARVDPADVEFILQP